MRGGVDQASVDKRWREAAWEIREGATIEGTEKVAGELGIDYIVVHKDQSDEFYHDFKNVEKFKDIAWELIYEENGDLIYKVK